MYRVLRGGYHCRHSESFLMLREQGLECYVILLVKSPARFRIGENSFEVKSHSVVIIPPNISYEYSGLDGEYINDWMHFECPGTSLEEKYGALLCRSVPLNTSQQISQYFQQILWEQSYACEEFKAQNVSMLFQVMLNKLYQEAESAIVADIYPYSAGLRELRFAMQSRPNKNFTPEEMADVLGVSPSYFQHLYKEFFGIPFKKDLINMRIDYAQYLITNTNMKLEQVALMSGYSSEVHFYRQFKAKMGMTPRKYMLTERERGL